LQAPNSREERSGGADGGFMSRLTKAMIAYLALAGLAFATLSDYKIRSLTLLILGLFAFKSWIRRNDSLQPDADGDSD
jgi:hypothetical protein